jgi:hypothetical protein
VETLYANLRNPQETQTSISAKDLDKIEAMDSFKAAKREKQLLVFTTYIKETSNAQSIKPSEEFNKDDILAFFGLLITNMLSHKELWRHSNIKIHLFEEFFYGSLKQTKAGRSWKNLLQSLKFYSLSDSRLDTICMILDLSSRKIDVNTHVNRLFLVLFEETKHSIGKIFELNPSIQFSLSEASKIILKYFQLNRVLINSPKNFKRHCGFLIGQSSSYYVNGELSHLSCIELNNSLILYYFYQSVISDNTNVRAVVESYLDSPEFINKEKFSQEIERRINGINSTLKELEGILMSEFGDKGQISMYKLLLYFKQRREFKV